MINLYIRGFQEVFFIKKQTHSSTCISEEFATFQCNAMYITSGKMFIAGKAQNSDFVLN